MKLSIGIVGLPNVGKSTLFKILTKQEVNTANYPFATIDPNVGVVPAPDERLEKIAAVAGSKKVLPAVLEFIDIAGLVAGAHQGRGLGNQFLAHIRETDALIHLVRIFKDKEIIHFEGESNPLHDLETVFDELKAKDETSKEKINLLSAKPQLILLNGKEGEADAALLEKIKTLGYRYFVADLKDACLSGRQACLVGRQAPAEEILRKIFGFFQEILELIVFFTANENECRSWFVKKGTKAPSAAGVVHTDFETKFIRAEVINWKKLIEVGGWVQAKQKGWLRLEGRDYVVQEGDVMVIRHG